MISGETNLRQKKPKFCKKNKLQHITISSMLYTKIHNFNQISSKYLVNVLLNSIITFALYFHELLLKKSVKMRQDMNLRQDTVCLEQ